MVANVETMFYHGEIPWHGQGTCLDHPATAEEAIKAAGLDWKVLLKFVYITEATGAFNLEAFTPIHYRAVVRETDGQVYGVVSPSYCPIQNHEAFGFFDSVVGEGKAIYHTAGSLGYGERIWILAKLSDPLDIAGDEIERYLLLVNSHDGTQALQMFFTPVRVVCQNTLNMASAQRSSMTFYAKHTRGIMNKAGEARDILGLAEKWYTEFEKRAQYMASRTLPEPDRSRFIRASLGIAEKMPMESVYKPIKEAYELVGELAERGAGNDKHRGTQWAAYNGLTDYVDHHRQARSKKPGAHMTMALFGSGNEIKKRGWDFLKVL
jgi:phage/plasmid-like protein (TIGR03299 family)